MRYVQIVLIFFRVFWLLSNRNRKSGKNRSLVSEGYSCFFNVRKYCLKVIIDVNMDMLCIILRQSKLCVHYHFFSVILPPSREMLNIK